MAGHPSHLLYDYGTAHVTHNICVCCDVVRVSLVRDERKKTLIPVDSLGIGRWADEYSQVPGLIISFDSGN